MEGNSGFPIAVLLIYLSVFAVFIFFFVWYHITGFTSYLLGPEGDIFNPEHSRVNQDMTRPLSHYFIASSHNTYVDLSFFVCLFVFCFVLFCFFRYSVVFIPNELTRPFKSEKISEKECTHLKTHVSKPANG